MRTAATTRAGGAYDRLAAKVPNEVEVLRDRAVMYNEIVETYLALGDTQSIAAAAEHSVAIAERLAGRAGASAKDRQGLALALVKLGDAREETGDLAQAHAAHQRACTASRVVR